MEESRSHHKKGSGSLAESKKSKEALKDYEKNIHHIFKNNYDNESNDPDEVKE